MNCDTLKISSYEIAGVDMDSFMLQTIYMKVWEYMQIKYLRSFGIWR